MKSAIDTLQARTALAREALTALVEREHRYLRDSQAADGYELTEIESMEDDELGFCARFEVRRETRTLFFKYSLGCDFDDGLYTPSGEVIGGDHRGFDLSVRRVPTGKFAVGEELIAAVELLSAVAGDARYEAFQWLASDRERPAPRD